MGENGGESGAKGRAKKPSGAQRRRDQKAAEEARKTAREAEEQAAAVAASLPPGDEDELTAMRHVMNNPTDRTYQHWSFRKSWNRNPEKFEDQYHRLVREEARSRSTSSGATTAAAPTETSMKQVVAGPVGIDQGMQNLGELLGERLVMARKVRDHGAEFLKWLESRPQSEPSTPT